MARKEKVIPIDSYEEPKAKRPKRRHGEGTYYMEGGRYCWRVTTNDINPKTGKKKSKVIKRSSKRDLNRAVKEYKDELNLRRGKTASKQTFEDFINRWFYNTKVNKLKPGSFDRQENTIKHQIIPHIGHLQISTITIDDIQTMINNLKKEGLSYSTIKKAYDTTNECFKYALLHDAVFKNPVLGVTMPSEAQFEKTEIRIFTEEEMERIEKELYRKYSTGKPVYYYPDAFMLMAHTGLRVGEMLGLEWNDINWEEKSIFVQRNVVSVKNRDVDDISETSGYKNLVQDSTKTFTSTRTIFLNNTAYEALSNLKKQSKNDTYVMNNSKGNRVSMSNMSKTFYRLLDNVGIERCGMHSLRHTFASRLFAKKVDVKTVSEILGHSSVVITYNTYIHLLPKQKQEATALLDRVDADKTDI